MKSRAVTVMILVLALTLLPACGGGENGGTPIETAGSPDDTVITIGNLTDQTGPAANAMHVINMALEDLVKYFNEQNLIPGVRLEVVTYDEQYDPSRDIPGYEWLRERGADLIFSSVPAAVVTLRDRAEKDRTVLFGVSGDLDVLAPPGYVFTVGTIPQHEAFTLLDWIAENDWDYQANGPAKIGGAAWNDSYFGWWMAAMKEYAEAHPDQYEWKGGYLTDFGFTWGPEAEALRDCDYVLASNPMINFVREFRNIGGSAKFIGTSTHLSFLGLVDDANMWDEIDGMLLVCCTRWWNEHDMLIDLTNTLLNQDHPDSAASVRRSGVGYIALTQLYLMLEIVGKAVAEVGPEGFDSQALYQAAQSYSIVVDGVERFSFSDTKRYAPNYYGIYRASGAEKDILRNEAEWYPAILAP